MPKFEREVSNYQNASSHNYNLEKNNIEVSQKIFLNFQQIYEVVVSHFSSGILFQVNLEFCPELPINSNIVLIITDTWVADFPCFFG
jgi:ABC-type uncharacterized transport system YnjBCD ATPase subunit